MLIQEPQPDASWDYQSHENLQVVKNVHGESQNDDKKLCQSATTRRQLKLPLCQTLENLQVVKNVHGESQNGDKQLC